MADDISIKLATVGCRGCFAILRVTATESDAVLVPHLNEISEKTEAKNIDLINQFDDCVILLTMLGEEIVGMVTVMVLDHQPTTGELGVVVRKKYWRNGIGRLLVDEAEYWFNTYSSLENLVLTVFLRIIFRQLIFISNYTLLQ